MTCPHRYGTVPTLLVFAAFTVWSASTPDLLGQSGKSKTKPAKPLSANEAKQIDSRLEKLQETFSSESTAIIEGYERSGQYEKAKFLLEVLMKLDPKNEALKKRISDMDERILDRTEVDQKFNAGSDWTLVGIVHKDTPARIEATGEYKFAIATISLGPDGFPSEDAMRDLMSQVPTGALMGMILTEQNKKDKKTPDPFTVKSKYDFTPKNDGELYLKINAPSGSKCIGDLKLKLNGITRGS